MGTILRLAVCAALWLVAVTELHAGEWSVRRITSSGGLPSNNVNDMAQDADGYIWMGTANGLCRYDGYSSLTFHSLGRAGGREIEESVMRVIPDNANGLVWAYTLNFINVCYDVRKASFVDYTGKDDCERPYMRQCLTADGMWLYGVSPGVRHVRYDGSAFATEDLSAAGGELADDRVLRIEAGSGRNTWIMTAGGVTAVPAGGKARLLLRGHEMTACARYGQQMLFLSSDGTLRAYGPDLRLRRKCRTDGWPGIKAAEVTGTILYNGHWLIFTSGTAYSVSLAGAARCVEAPEELRLADGREAVTDGRCRMVWNPDGDVLIVPERGRASRMRLDVAGGMSVIKAVETDGGIIYVATDRHGLFGCDPVRRTVSRYMPGDSSGMVVSGELLAIMASRDGSLWISNGAQGVTQVSRSETVEASFMVPVPESDDDKSNIVRTVSAAGHGAFAVSTRDNRLYALSPDSGVFRLIGRFPACVYQYFTDKDGHVWTATRGAGFYVDGERYSRHGGIRELTSDDIYDIKQDRLGRIWISTWDGGLLMTRYERGKRLRFRKFIAGRLKENRLRKMCIDRDGRLWIASTNGLYVTDTRIRDISESDFRCFSKADGTFPVNNVICVCAGSDGTVWAGTQGYGLVRCRLSDGGTRMLTRMITKDNGLVNDNVVSVAEDGYGTVWAGTENGLSRVDTHGCTATGYMPCSVAVGNICVEDAICVTDDGRLLVGTRLGVMAVRLPGRDAPVRRSMRPLFSDIRINGRSLYDGYGTGGLLRQSAGGPVLTLAHDQNTVRVSFSNMDFAHAGSSHYMYVLDGIDRSWHYTTDRNYAEYSYLPPGRYTFRLRAMSGGGGWSDEAVLEVVIRQPWYNTWWAWLCYAAAVSALGWWLFMLWRRAFRLRQQMRIEREMSEFRIGFFTHIAHEFRTPLTLIQSAADKLSHPEDSTSQRSAAQTVRRGTQRLMRQVNLLMEFRRISTGNMRLCVEQDDIVKFVRCIFQDFWGMARQKDMAYAFYPSASSLVMTFDRQKVETMVYNLLGNAIKYTPRGGSVTLRLAEDNGGGTPQLTIAVEDTGPGLTDRQKETLFRPFMHGYVNAGGMGIGLYVAHEMAVLHGGDLTYCQPESGGSVFRIILPGRGSTYPQECLAVSTESRDGRENGDAGELKEMASLPMNGRVVAIIEDEPEISELIKSEIGVYFRTVCYPDGMSALDGMAENCPDMVLCDVMLPGIDGYEVVRRLRKADNTRFVPVIMLTALDDEAHQLRAYRAGADDYAVKPCNFRLLAARMARLMAWAERGAAACPERRDEAVPGKIIVSKSDKLFVEQVKEVVARRASDPDFNADGLAACLRMGRSKLYGGMRELMGVTPNKYIMDERLKMAERLVSEGLLTVSEISYKVGFVNVSYFIRCFKGKYGVTPAKYGKD